MSIINKGTAFSNGEQLSANKLNDLLDAATFGIDSVDNASTIVNANGAITVRDSGVTAAKLATGAVTASKILDANVTKAKIENVADYKVLGNVSGAAAAPAEVAILDEDDMTSDSDTALATQQSIKAYVDSLGLTTTLPSQSGGVSTEGEQGSMNVGPLIIKYGTINSTGGTTSYSFTDAFPSAIIGVNTTVQERVGSASYTSGADTLTTSGFVLQSYIDTSFGAVGRVFFVAYGF
jgi:hypothetical protein